MTELNADFAPDWVSHPGESILDIAEERGWSQLELAQRMGYSEKHMSLLINGKVSLSVEAAQKLERVVGGSVESWLAREANYQTHKARLAAVLDHEQWADWLDTLPVKALMANGSIPSNRLTSSNKPAIVEACLRFFGVASPEEWRRHYGQMQLAFRKKTSKTPKIGAIAAWLRLGEKQAEQQELVKFNKGRFEKALQRIRHLGCEQPEILDQAIRKLLTESGVLFVLVPAIPGAGVSGVARWLGPTRPMIQMSLLGKTNDKFWFTFFHEAAHLLLHSGSNDAKKSIFLDSTHDESSNDPQELEADAWASNWLIPPIHEPRLRQLVTEQDVCEFATELGIHPGTVVGRMQHEGIIANNRMNNLKLSLTLTPCNEQIGAYRITA